MESTSKYVLRGLSLQLGMGGILFNKWQLHTYFHLPQKLDTHFPHQDSPFHFHLLVKKKVNDGCN